MKKAVTFWISTLFVAAVMGISGGLAISHAGRFMAALAHLGYPPYFSNILGVAKLVGIFFLLARGFGKVKEWVYAGFAFTVLSACYSHYMSGDGLLALDPLATFAALVISYWTRPANRRLAIPSHPEATPQSLDRHRQWASGELSRS